MTLFRLYSILLGTTLLLCGFSWGLGNDSCTKAQELSSKLESLHEESEIRLAEAQILSLCPDGAAAHFVSALQLERVGNIDGAIGEYRKCLQQQRSFPEASGNLGLLYAQKGMNDEAMVELSRGLSANSNPRYHKAMGRILAEQKVYPLAIHHLSEAGRELSRDTGIGMSLADIYTATGKTDKALEEYRRVLVIDPNHEQAHIRQAALLLDRNETDKALEELKQAELVNPQNRDVHLMMAVIYEKKGDTKQADYRYLLGGKPKKDQPQVVPAAVKLSDAAVTTDADSTATVLQAALKDSPEKAVEIYEKLGNAYRLAGKDAEAIAAYREAAHRNSTSSDVYLNLGILYEKEDKLDEAVVAYKQAINAKPSNADARLRLANIRDARGFYQEAVEQYVEFLKLKPDSPDIQLKLARIFARNKELNLAIDAYKAVLKQLPDNLEANRELAPLYRAKGMNDKAIEHYKRALAQQKDDVETRTALVAIYVKNKQYDEITELLKGAVELFPEDANNHYKLGLIYEFKKDYESAIASYKKAAELKPDHARSLNALGRLYMKTGRITEAKEVLEAAKTADPNLEETAILLNNIRDEFSPEPKKISKKLKTRSGKKTKKGKASKSSKSKKPQKKGTAKSKK
ncbi:tetratricopeptide repeat protein [Pelotalea chapellei]|uniref:Tetratricopeptide repeat protein n=1 Tax=Pelotalea chapellei TaxID=44671 RepID=A0ABS5U8X3_9BACT|nr:tetratricopeptide repeat protein [Pelotalea chapellei]MBT1072127.1 tetratricopeptide repeat protein [Pelotalea chapellei]